ncbi:MAG: AAA family ATPase, partial [Burkholderiales bacterium]
MERERLQQSATASDTFVGRERELAALRAAVGEAIEGRGHMFLVSGEPGIGKTRLAEEASREAARRGMRVLWGRCWEGGGVPAYWPIIQILRGCAERPDFSQLVETLGGGIAQVASLVPEVVPRAAYREQSTGAERIDPERARFRLFDAVAT